jgi:hypothetical protein
MDGFKLLVSNFIGIPVSDGAMIIDHKDYGQVLRKPPKRYQPFKEYSLA